MNISVYINGRNTSTFDVVSSICLEVETSQPVDTRTALLLAGNKVTQFLNAARAAKRAGARLAYKMTMPHTIEVELDGEVILDTRDAGRIFENAARVNGDDFKSIMDARGSFTFKSITAGKATINLAGAFEVMAAYATTEA